MPEPSNGTVHLIMREKPPQARPSCEPATDAEDNIVRNEAGDAGTIAGNPESEQTGGFSSYMVRFEVATSLSP